MAKRRTFWLWASGRPPSNAPLMRPRHHLSGWRLRSVIQKEREIRDQPGAPFRRAEAPDELVHPKMGQRQADHQTSADPRDRSRAEGRVDCATDAKKDHGRTQRKHAPDANGREE